MLDMTSNIILGMPQQMFSRIPIYDDFGVNNAFIANGTTEDMPEAFYEKREYLEYYSPAFIHDIGLVKNARTGHYTTELPAFLRAFIYRPEDLTTNFYDLYHGPDETWYIDPVNLYKAPTDTYTLITLYLGPDDERDMYIRILDQGTLFPYVRTGFYTSTNISGGVITVTHPQEYSF